MLQAVKCNVMSLTQNHINTLSQQTLVAVTGVEALCVNIGRLIVIQRVDMLCMDSLSSAEAVQEAANTSKPFYKAK